MSVPTKNIQTSNFKPKCSLFVKSEHDYEFKKAESTDSDLWKVKTENIDNFVIKENKLNISATYDHASCSTYKNRSNQDNNIEESYFRHKLRPLKSEDKTSIKSSSVVTARKSSTNSSPRVSCDLCGKSYKNVGHLNRHKQSHSAKRMKCSHCEKTFAVKENYTLHQKLHQDDRRYKCNQCGKSYVTPSRLRDHLFVHSGYQPFSCSECPSKFTTRNNLKQHIQVHNGNRSHWKYKCDVCDLICACPSKLKQHHLIHKDIRPYSCDICCKTFKRPTHVTSHKLNVHTKIKGEKHTADNKKQIVAENENCKKEQFGCDKCGKMFSKAQILVTHLKVHLMKHKCKICNQDFNDKDDLVIHNKIHKGEAFYSCDVCFKRFAVKKNLLQHKNQHSVDTDTSSCTTAANAKKQHSVDTDTSSCTTAANAKMCDETDETLQIKMEKIEK